MEEKKGRRAWKAGTVPYQDLDWGGDGALARDISGEADRVAVLARMDRCMNVQ